jgi:regulator of protease activity HflC (stomatin/prohibitin superfamily)
MVFLVSLLTALLSISLGLYSSFDKNSPLASRKQFRLICFLIFMIAALTSISRTFRVIKTGYVGVSEFLGNVSQETLKPGLHLVNPLADIYKFSTRIEDITQNIETTDTKGLKFNIDVSLQYRVDPTRAVQVYENVGSDGEEILISRFRSIVREVVGTKPFEAVVSRERQKIASQIQERLSEVVAPIGFVVEQVLLREIVYPVEVQKAIEDKIKAEQEQQKILIQVEQERKEAEITRIKAQAEADAQRIKAQADADAQAIISKTLTPLLLRHRAIEAAEKIGTSPNSKVHMIMGNSQGEINPVILSGLSDKE